MGSDYQPSSMRMFEYQPPAELDQANPNQNQWYPLLPATDFCRVYKASVQVAAVNETLQVRVTIDGQVSIVQSFNATFGTIYHIYVNPYATDQTIRFHMTPTLNEVSHAFLCEGHNVMIEVRKTSAAGAGNLTGVASFGVLT